MTNLPFIGKLNTVFIVAVAIGMGIILLTMVLNIINSLRDHDPEKAYFDTNGAAGLVFYAAMVATVVLYMTCLLYTSSPCPDSPAPPGRPPQDRFFLPPGRIRWRRPSPFP